MDAPTYYAVAVDLPKRSPAYRLASAIDLVRMRLGYTPLVVHVTAETAAELVGYEGMTVVADEYVPDARHYRFPRVADAVV